MSVAIIGCRRWESSLVKSCHEGKLFHTCDTRHVKPSTRSSLQVVSIVFNSSETCATKPGKLNDDWLTIVYTLTILVNLVTALTDIDIRLLTDTNLGENSFDMPSFHEHFNGQIIIALVSQRVPTIIFAGVEDKFVL